MNCYEEANAAAVSSMRARGLASLLEWVQQNDSPVHPAEFAAAAAFRGLAPDDEVVLQEAVKAGLKFC